MIKDNSALFRPLVPHPIIVIVIRNYYSKETREELTNCSSLNDVKCHRENNIRGLANIAQTIRKVARGRLSPKAYNVLLPVYCPCELLPVNTTVNIPWQVYCWQHITVSVLLLVYCQYIILSMLLSVYYCQYITGSELLTAFYCQQTTVSVLLPAYYRQRTTVTILLLSVHYCQHTTIRVVLLVFSTQSTGGQRCDTQNRKKISL